MKIVIEHGRTKRQIEGAFNICGSKEDLISIAQQILGAVHEDNSFAYGWVNIRTVRQEPPKGWEE